MDQKLLAQEIKIKEALIYAGQFISALLEINLNNVSYIKKLKISAKFIYNSLCKYLTDNSILYKKQFGFQEGHSAELAIVQLIDQTRNRFESNQYTLDVFVNLSKAFDTVNNKTLISKLRNNGIRGKKFLWFVSY